MNELLILTVSAASLGFAHTILGPDHYLPFIVLGKARQWSMVKTMWITFISGVGHVGSSIVIGIVGILLGVSLSKLESIETFRGEIVGWLLFAFGVAYTFYGVWKYMQNAHHRHLPSFLLPARLRGMRHLPNDENQEDNTKLTPWVLFLIFVFGPCEILIPLLLFPAYEHTAAGVALVALVFGTATILTMMATVYLGLKGSALLRVKNPARYMHLAAGLVILVCSSGMLFLGW